MEGIIVVVFLYIIQSCLLFYVGLGFFNIFLDYRILILNSIIFSFFILLVRQVYMIFSIPFGTHTAFLIIILVIMHRYLSKVQWGIAFAASLMGMILVLLGSTFSQLFVEIFQLSGSEILGKPWLHVAIGNTENIPLFIAFLAIKIFGIDITKSFDINID